MHKLLEVPKLTQSTGEVAAQCVVDVVEEWGVAHGLSVVSTASNSGIRSGHAPSLKKN